MKTEVLGIPFDNLTLSEAADAVEALFGKGGYVITANPELILACRKNGMLRAALQKADLVTADGVGDLLAARILGRPLAERVTGSDLAPELLRRLSARGGSVFLYGARPGVALRAARALEKTYPGLRIAGAENGYLSDETALWAELAEKKPDLLLLGLGAPRQELWMAQNAVRFPGTVCLGGGGLLDVFAGDVARAPLWIQKANLEWLFRLAQQPGRLPRMIRLPKVLVLAAKEKMNTGKE